MSSDLRTAAAYCLDRFSMTVQMPVMYGPGYNFRARQVTQADTAVYREPSFIKDPAKFYQKPATTPYVHMAQIYESRDERVYALSFKSAFTPVNHAFRDQYDQYFANHTAYARFHELKDRDRAPVLISLHGWTGKSFKMVERMDGTAAFRKAGVHTVTWAHPYHMARKPQECKFSGEYYFSGDLARTAEAVAQNIYDLRCLVSFFLERGHIAVGIIGGSLGGYTALMMAVAEPRILFSIALVPPGNIPRLFYYGRGQLSYQIRRGFKIQDLSYEEVSRVWGPISPHNFKPVIPKERVLIVAGRGDGYVPPDSPQEVWEAWDKPPIVWYPGGHLSAVLPWNQKLIAAAIKDFLEPFTRTMK